MKFTLATLTSPHTHNSLLDGKATMQQSLTEESSGEGYHEELKWSLNGANKTEKTDEEAILGVLASEVDEINFQKFSHQLVAPPAGYNCLDASEMNPNDDCLS